MTVHKLLGMKPMFLTDFEILNLTCMYSWIFLVFWDRVLGHFICINMINNSFMHAKIIFARQVSEESLKLRAIVIFPSASVNEFLLL